MASAAARRGESHTTVLDHTNSPSVIPPESPNSRAMTPRPSISPLSSASKTHKSPVTTRDGIRLSYDSPHDNGWKAPIHMDTDLSEHQDDRSSSLSEPKDDPEEDESMYNVKGLHSVQRSLEVDSEAETERLEQTPQKPRRSKIQLGVTPTKLSHAIAVGDDFSDPLSPVPMDADSELGLSLGSGTGYKRKRSESIESPLSSAASDVGESPRKRPHPFSELEQDIDDDESTMNGLEEMSKEADEEEEEDIEAVADAAVNGYPRKTLKNNKRQSKSQRNREFDPEQAFSAGDDTADREEELDPETVARLEEEKQHKSEASTFFEDLAKQFTAFKEKLYTERLEGLNAELSLLAQPNCAHPEYLRQVAAINGRMEKQTREAHAAYRYRLHCIRDRTLAERSQMHSQFYQEVREARERTMNKLGEDWYNIQKERRQSHQEKDSSYLFMFPEKKSVQIRHQAKYNHEVSVLSGVAKYVGFPAAPDVQGAQGDALEADLKAMKISRRAARQNALPPRSVLLSRDAAVNERLAHEKYLEQNAWARPQAPIQQHGTPNLTHTPDWADLPGQSRTAPRNQAGHAQHGAAVYSTPLSQKGLPVDPSNQAITVMNQEGSIALPASQNVTPATNAPDPFRISNAEQDSLPHIAKQRQNGGESGNFRNFSNVSRISGASTIDAASETEREREPSDAIPPFGKQSGVPAPGFDINHMQHLNESGNKDAFAAPGFLSQQGAFGTPAPLSTNTGLRR